MAAKPAPVTFQPIGVIHSCFRQKFAIPRQPGLAPSALAELELLPPFDHPDTIRGLEECSHVWLLFLFSEHLDQGWSPLVRPPRAKGGKRGVFATRSTFRPNPVGLSVVRLEGTEIRDGRARLRLSGVDLLDGTPVIDIKPYLPYADRIEEARYGWAEEAERHDLPVRFGPQAERVLGDIPAGSELRQLITEVLQQDPRPVYQRRQSTRTWAMALDGWNVRWQMGDNGVEVVALEPWSGDGP